MLKNIKGKLSHHSITQSQTSVTSICRFRKHKPSWINSTHFGANEGDNKCTGEATGEIIAVSLSFQTHFSLVLLCACVCHSWYHEVILIQLIQVAQNCRCINAVARRLALCPTNLRRRGICFSVLGGTFPKSCKMTSSRLLMCMLLLKLS